MNLQKNFAVLKPELLVETIPVSPGVYRELDERFNGFQSHLLVSSYQFESDWGVWEKHPAGDEIVVLLSGAACMVMETETGRESVELEQPGDYVVIPRDTWHTAQVAELTQMLFVTPGEGTEHRQDAPGG